VWHSLSDSASCSCFELEFFAPHISAGESRRMPRQADSLPRGANTAETRYSSDIVVNVRTIAVFPSCRDACLNELNKLIVTPPTAKR